MAQSRARVGLVVALVVAAALAVVAPRPATADVTAVKGAAAGVSASVSLFNGPVQTRGPEPTVTLPATGSAAPVTGTAAPTVQFGPAVLFSAERVDVSTDGRTGAGGSVTSATRVVRLNTSGQEVLSASELTSTCTASEAGVTGAATISGGRLQTSEGNPNVTGDEVFVDIPANPAPNTAVNGQLQSVGDTFQYIFNEQIRNADGSITVYAAHQRLLGPTAVGDVYIGRVDCGVTATAATTTTTTGGTTTTAAPGATTTTAAPGATTTTAAPAATTTTTAATTTTTTGATTTTTPAPASTTTTAAGGGTTGVSGGAYGFYTSVALFGGAPGTRGPTPAVTLPAAGSATPITDTAASGDARFGPAVLFSSDQLDVSTQGTPGGTVTSSAKAVNVNRSGQEQFTAASVSSTCTASASGESGSTSISGGKLTVSDGANLDSEADDTVVQIPADPAPNTSYDGKIENVGDTFRVVVNEHQRSSGSITVNAVHLYLQGPTAVGELIIAQSRCGLTAAGTGGGTTGGGQSGAVSAAGGRVATTGTEALALVALALLLATGGGTTTLWSRTLRGRRPGIRSMPWGRRGLLR